MPPRKRQNRPPDREPADRMSADPDQSPREDEEADESVSSLPLPFYNTTFSAHRVSPLYLSSEPLTGSRLQTLAQRLRDKLVGDVVRGVEVGLGLEDAGIGRAGALERVEIHWVGVADVLDISHEELEGLGGEDEEGAEGGTINWQLATAQLPSKKALHISLRYETASCTALMLPPLAGDTEGAGGPDAAETRFAVGSSVDEMDWERSDPSHFLALPLLLLRMPAPLKTVIGDFLSTSFDCRVSPMRLGTRSLVRSWEAWIKSVGLPSRGPLSRDVVLSLGFYVPPPEKAENSAAPRQAAGEDAAAAEQPLGLRSIDVIIPAAELRKFVAAGERLARGTEDRPAAPAVRWGWEDDPKKRRRLAGRLYEEGWEGRTAGRGNHPFTEALACYLKEHLALNLFHPGARVIKIACGGFAMSEARLKLFTPAGSGEDEGSLPGQRGAVLELLAGLVEKAQARTAG